MMNAPAEHVPVLQEEFAGRVPSRSRSMRCSCSASSKPMTNEGRSRRREGSRGPELRKEAINMLGVGGAQSCGRGLLVDFYAASERRRREKARDQDVACRRTPDLVLKTAPHQGRSRGTSHGDRGARFDRGLDELVQLLETTQDAGNRRASSRRWASPAT